MAIANGSMCDSEFGLSVDHSNSEFLPADDPDYFDGLKELYGNDYLYGEVIEADEKINNFNTEMLGVVNDYYSVANILSTSSSNCEDHNADWEVGNLTGTMCVDDFGIIKSSSTLVSKCGIKSEFFDDASTKSEEIDIKPIFGPSCIMTSEEFDVASILSSGVSNTTRVIDIRPVIYSNTTGGEMDVNFGDNVVGENPEVVDIKPTILYHSNVSGTMPADIVDSKPVISSTSRIVDVQRDSLRSADPTLKDSFSRTANLSTSLSYPDMRFIKTEPFEPTVTVVGTVIDARDDNCDILNSAFKAEDIRSIVSDTIIGLDDIKPVVSCTTFAGNDVKPIVSRNSFRSDCVSPGSIFTVDDIASIVSGESMIHKEDKDSECIVSTNDVKPIKSGKAMITMIKKPIVLRKVTINGEVGSVGAAAASTVERVDRTTFQESRQTFVSMQSAQRVVLSKPGQTVVSIQLAQRVVSSTKPVQMVSKPGKTVCSGPSVQRFASSKPMTSVTITKPTLRNPVNQVYQPDAKKTTPLSNHEKSLGKQNSACLIPVSSFSSSVALTPAPRFPMASIKKPSSFAIPPPIRSNLMVKHTSFKSVVPFTRQGLPQAGHRLVTVASRKTSINAKPYVNSISGQQQQSEVYKQVFAKLESQSGSGSLVNRPTASVECINALAKSIPQVVTVSCVKTVNFSSHQSILRQSDVNHIQPQRFSQPYLSQFVNVTSEKLETVHTMKRGRPPGAASSVKLTTVKCPPQDPIKRSVDVGMAVKQTIQMHSPAKVDPLGSSSVKLISVLDTAKIPTFRKSFTVTNKKSSPDVVQCASIASDLVSIQHVNVKAVTSVCAALSNVVKSTPTIQVHSQNLTGRHAASSVAVSNTTNLVQAAPTIPVYSQNWTVKRASTSVAVSNAANLVQTAPTIQVHSQNLTVKHATASVAMSNVANTANFVQAAPTILVRSQNFKEKHAAPSVAVSIAANVVQTAPKIQAHSQNLTVKNASVAVSNVANLVRTVSKIQAHSQNSTGNHALTNVAGSNAENLVQTAATIQAHSQNSTVNHASIDVANRSVPLIESVDAVVKQVGVHQQAVGQTLSVDSVRPPAVAFVMQRSVDAKPEAVVTTSFNLGSVDIIKRQDSQTSLVFASFGATSVESAIIDSVIKIEPTAVDSFEPNIAIKIEQKFIESSESVSSSSEQPASEQVVSVVLEAPVIEQKAKKVVNLEEYWKKKGIVVPVDHVAKTDPPSNSALKNEVAEDTLPDKKSPIDNTVLIPAENQLIPIMTLIKTKNRPASDAAFPKKSTAVTVLSKWRLLFIDLTKSSMKKNEVRHVSSQNFNCKIHYDPRLNRHSPAEQQLLKDRPTVAQWEWVARCSDVKCMVYTRTDIDVKSPHQMSCEANETPPATTSPDIQDLMMSSDTPLFLSYLTPPSSCQYSSGENCSSESPASESSPIHTCVGTPRKSDLNPSTEKSPSSKHSPKPVNESLSWTSCNTTPSPNTVSESSSRKVPIGRLNDSNIESQSNPSAASSAEDSTGKLLLVNSPRSRSRSPGECSSSESSTDSPIKSLRSSRLSLMPKSLTPKSLTSAMTSVDQSESGTRLQEVSSAVLLDTTSLLPLTSLKGGLHGHRNYRQMRSRDSSTESTRGSTPKRLKRSHSRENDRSRTRSRSRSRSGSKARTRKRSYSSDSDYSDYSPENSRRSSSGRRIRKKTRRGSRMSSSTRDARRRSSQRRSNSRSRSRSSHSRSRSRSSRSYSNSSDEYDDRRSYYDDRHSRSSSSKRGRSSESRSSRSRSPYYRESSSRSSRQGQERNDEHNYGRSDERKNNGRKFNRSRRTGPQTADEAKLERKEVFVGHLPKDYTHEELARRLKVFGEITKSRVCPAKSSDNDDYGFVTFATQSAAFKCIDNGRTVPGCEQFTFGVGGRRAFCDIDYMDLDKRSTDSKKDSELTFEELLLRYKKQ